MDLVYLRLIDRYTNVSHVKLYGKRLYVIADQNLIIYNLTSKRIRTFELFEDEFYNVKVCCGKIITYSLRNVWIRDKKGKVLLNKKISKYDAIPTDCFINESIFAFSNNNGMIYVYDLASFTLVYQINTLFNAEISYFYIHNNIVYVTAGNREYSSSFKLENDYHEIFDYNFAIMNMVVYHGLLYSSEFSCIHVLDSSGIYLKNIKTPDDVYDLQIYNDRLWFEIYESGIFYIDPNSESIVRSGVVNNLEPEPIFDICISNEKIYAYNNKGEIVSYGVYYSDFKSLPDSQKSKITAWESFCANMVEQQMYYTHCIHKDIRLMISRALLA